MVESIGNSSSSLDNRPPASAPDGCAVPAPFRREGIDTVPAAFCGGKIDQEPPKEKSEVAPATPQTCCSSKVPLDKCPRVAPKKRIGHSRAHLGHIAIRHNAPEEQVVPSTWLPFEILITKKEETQTKAFNSCLAFEGRGSQDTCTGNMPISTKAANAQGCAPLPASGAEYLWAPEYLWDTGSARPRSRHGRSRGTSAPRARRLPLVPAELNHWSSPAEDDAVHEAAERALADGAAAASRRRRSRRRQRSRQQTAQTRASAVGGGQVALRVSEAGSEDPWLTFAEDEAGPLPCASDAHAGRAFPHAWSPERQERRAAWRARLPLVQARSRLQSAAEAESLASEVDDMEANEDVLDVEVGVVRVGARCSDPRRQSSNGKDIVVQRLPRSSFGRRSSPSAMFGLVSGSLENQTLSEFASLRLHEALDAAQFVPQSSDEGEYWQEGPEQHTHSLEEVQETRPAQKMNVKNFMRAASKAVQFVTRTRILAVKHGARAHIRPPSPVRMTSGHIEAGAWVLGDPLEPRRSLLQAPILEPPLVRQPVVHQPMSPWEILPKAGDNDSRRGSHRTVKFWDGLDTRAENHGQKTQAAALLGRKRPERSKASKSVRSV